MKKRAMLFVLLLAFMALTVIIGCATYNPRIGIPDWKTFQETGVKAVNPEAGITVVAYPIQTKEDAELYFDSASLVKDGLLPVYVHVNISVSDTEKNYRIGSIFLRMENRNIPAISAETAYGLIKKSYALRVAFWASWTYFVGGPISAAHTAYVNKKIEKDLKEKEMQEGEIKKDASGFLYFRMPDDIKFLDNFSLEFVLVDKNSQNLVIRVLLKGQITAR